MRNKIVRVGMARCAASAAIRASAVWVEEDRGESDVSGGVNTTVGTPAPVDWLWVMKWPMAVTSAGMEEEGRKSVSGGPGCSGRETPSRVRRPGAEAMMAVAYPGVSASGFPMKFTWRRDIARVRSVAVVRPMCVMALCPRLSSVRIGLRCRMGKISWIMFEERSRTCRWGRGWTTKGPDGECGWVSCAKCERSEMRLWERSRTER